MPLSMAELGLGYGRNDERQFIKLTRGGAQVVTRPVQGLSGNPRVWPQNRLARDRALWRASDGVSGLRSGLRQRRRALSGLGDDTDTCGAQPTLATGEMAQCCPNVGWVVYTLGESQYGLCERAAAAAGLAASGTTSTSVATSSDPMAAVAALRAQIDARREAADAAHFEQQKQEMQLRFVAAQIQATQAAEAARQQAIVDAQNKKLRSEQLAREEKIQSEKTKQWLIAGAVGLAVAKALKLF